MRRKETPQIWFNLNSRFNSISLEPNAKYIKFGIHYCKLNALKLNSETF